MKLRSNISFKNKQQVRLRMVLRQNALLLSILFVAVSTGFIIYFLLGNNTNTLAAASGDYRTAGSGNWNGAATWQKFNGTSWNPTATPPTSANGVITIQSGNTVTITSGITVDQVVINAGGQVNLNSGLTLIIANGTGTDFDVSGVFNSAGTVTINASATIVFQSGGKYQHNFTTTAGIIPTATWISGSTCEVIGYTSNAAVPGGLQAFSNFTWNCPSQTAAIGLNGGLTTVNGNFTISSTGTNTLSLATNGSTLNVAGNYSQTGGTFTLESAASQTSTLNITGNFSLSGGTFSVVNGNSSTGIVNLSGNYSQTGGTLTEGGASPAVATIVFNNAGSQTFTSPVNNVTMNVDFTVNSGSILVMGTNICSGRNFTLSSGGGIQLGSATGITSSGLGGNIQVTGTRTFNTGADYTYNGIVAQVTGNGLPATVHNLTLNNSSNLTLTGTTGVTGTLALTSGKLITGANEIQTTTSSTTNITGYSSSNYIVGNLRRTITGSATYDFPVGTLTYYELLNISLSGVTGFGNILGTFTNVNPIAAGVPLPIIQLNGVAIEEMLDYGYWTLTPNAALTGGTYTLTLNEQGYSNIVSSGCTFCVLNRTNVASVWQALGSYNPNTQSSNGGIVTAVIAGLNTFGDCGIGAGDHLSFQNPVLQSGVAGQAGAVYVFPNVCSNTDAWVTLVSLSGGMTLSAIDNSASGYTEAFQPFLSAPTGGTSSILWDIAFKLAGTSTDTTLPFLAITGIDVDGSTNIKEFVEATMPYSYALNSPTSLTITNTNGVYRAASPFTGVSNIDTAQHGYMYQINYRNIHNFAYRTGVTNTTGSLQTRQTSLYFKSFFSGNMALPIKLVYFNAKLKDHKVHLNWATATEINNDYFTLERSADAENFEPLFTKRGAGNSTIQLFYDAIDENPLDGYSYYRLKQTDYDGQYSYSKIETVKNGTSDQQSTMDIQSISPNPFTTDFRIGFTTKSSGLIDFVLMNSTGKIIDQETFQSQDGYNTYEFMDKFNLSTGIYFVMLQFNDEQIVRKIIRQ